MRAALCSECLKARHGDDRKQNGPLMWMSTRGKVNSTEYMERECLNKENGVLMLQKPPWEECP